MAAADHQDGGGRVMREYLENLAAATALTVGLLALWLVLP